MILMLLTVELISIGVDLEQGSLLRVDQFKGQSDRWNGLLRPRIHYKPYYTKVVDENNLF